MGVFEPLTELASDIKFSKQKNKLAARARYIDDYNNIIEYPCWVHPSRKYALIDGLKKYVHRPIVYWDQTHQCNVLYIPSRSHTLFYSVIKDAAQNITTDITAEIKFGKEWLTLKFVSEGCLNWNLLRSEVSNDLAADANQVIHTTVLKRLDDGSGWRNLIAVILCVTFGYAIGMTTGLFASMILDWWL